MILIKLLFELDYCESLPKQFIRDGDERNFGSFTSRLQALITLSTGLVIANG